MIVFSFHFCLVDKEQIEKRWVNESVHIAEDYITEQKQLPIVTRLWNSILLRNASLFFDQPLDLPIISSVPQNY